MPAAADARRLDDFALQDGLKMSTKGIAGEIAYPHPQGSGESAPAGMRDPAHQSETMMGFETAMVLIAFAAAGAYVIGVRDGRRHARDDGNLPEPSPLSGDSVGVLMQNAIDRANANLPGRSRQQVHPPAAENSTLIGGKK
jgi:hypothetical protein